jgi:hypothetical protein
MFLASSAARTSVSMSTNWLNMERAVPTLDELVDELEEAR